MLNDYNVKASDSWGSVQPRLLKDPRYQAVIGERKLSLFKSYLTALAEAQDTQITLAEKDFKVQYLCTLHAWD